MSARPRALVLRAAGTNCHVETCRAFDMAGATPELVHVDELLADPSRLDAADLLCLPGGFAYGDDIAAGRVLAVRLRERIWPALRRVAERGVPVIGICNGFQALVQTGLLPGPPAGEPWPDEAPPAVVALAENAGGRFVDRWTPVEPDPDSPCVWTAGLLDIDPADRRLPIAHGEGRIAGLAPETLDGLAAEGRIPLRYLDNPNGSLGDVAGICDASGRIFGLMPHPERFLTWAHAPHGVRRAGPAPGLAMFAGAVRVASGATQGA